MTVPWEEARDEWARRKINEGLELVGKPEYAHAPGDVTIVDVDIDPGGSTQIGDMTWDYQAPGIDITYKVKGYDSTRTAWAELDFGKLVQEIVAVAVEMERAAL